MLRATVCAHLKFMVSIWASVPKSWSVFSPSSSHWSDENHYLFLQPLLHTCMVPSQPQEARLLIYSLHLFYFFFKQWKLRIWSAGETPPEKGTSTLIWTGLSTDPDKATLAKGLPLFAMDSRTRVNTCFTKSIPQTTNTACKTENNRSRLVKAMCFKVESLKEAPHAAFLSRQCI